MIIHPVPSTSTNLLKCVGGWARCVSRLMILGVVTYVLVAARTGTPTVPVGVGDVVGVAVWVR